MTQSLTRKEYNKILLISEKYITKENQRVGQALMNAISRVNSNVASELASSRCLNCYYTDKNLKFLIQYLSRIIE